jgi:hypothetical protein
MSPESLLPGFAWAASRLLFVLGLGFLAANLKVTADLVRYQWRKRFALLTWQNPKPRYYGLNLGLGVVLGLLIAYKLFVMHRQPDQLFGEAMMFVYYGYAFPLSARISRGFYRDGIWSDSGFLPWAKISAVSWKEEGRVTLILISHFRNIARRLEVPGPLYGQARRLLRDKIRDHAIHIGGSGLDLGSRDDQDTV